MYKAVLFHPEGDSVTDFRDSETIEEVLYGIDDMGSRWIFYPIWIVVDNNNIVVEAPEGMVHWVGKSRQEIKDILETEWQYRAEEVCEDLNNGIPLYLIY